MHNPNKAVASIVFTLPLYYRKYDKTVYISPGSPYKPHILLLVSSFIQSCLCNNNSECLSSKDDSGSKWANLRRWQDPGIKDRKNATLHLIQRTNGSQGQRQYLLAVSVLFVFSERMNSSLYPFVIEHHQNMNMYQNLDELQQRRISIFNYF
jgi:hypothetical protein